ncbi:MAG TPA: hypothetical protein VHW44_02055 [Pseudonocardiaceae bacterium]|nr:hypothetical protein [Pseudonocardiaceae bacterium]
MSGSTAEVAATAPATARLRQRDNVAKYVDFQFNPNSIKIGHSSDTKALNNSMGVVENPTEPTARLVASNSDVVTNVGDTTISFSEILLDGADVPSRCQQLLAWTYPVVTGSTGVQGVDSPSIPQLTFSWGQFDAGIPFQSMYLVLTKVDIDYSRFTQAGVATRAVVTISCKVKVGTVARQNPTSGGRPDRGGRVVIDGESIQSIALRRYGHVRHWRALAAANGVDDPLRVRPGDRLYLPGADELGGSET